MIDIPKILLLSVPFVETAEIISDPHIPAPPSEKNTAAE